MRLLSKLDYVQKRIIALYVFLICAAIGIYIFIIITGQSFACPIHKITGLYCPACGITRATINLLHFRFYEAFRNHPAFIIGAIVWFLISIFAFIGKPKCFRNSKVILKILYVTLALFVLFAIFRNIPGFEFLHPIS